MKTFTTIFSESESLPTLYLPNRATILPASASGIQNDSPPDWQALEMYEKMGRLVQ